MWFVGGLIVGLVAGWFLAVRQGRGKEKKEVVKKKKAVQKAKAEYEKEADRISEEVENMSDKEVVEEFDRLFGEGE